MQYSLFRSAYEVDAAAPEEWVEDGKDEVRLEGEGEEGVGHHVCASSASATAKQR